MNKAELISATVKETGLKKKDVKAVVDSLFGKVIPETLKKGEKVALVGFGTWEVKERKRRTGVNPRNGQKITIPAKAVPHFKVGKDLKRAVAK